MKKLSYHSYARHLVALGTRERSDELDHAHDEMIAEQWRAVTDEAFRFLPRGETSVLSLEGLAQSRANVDSVTNTTGGPFKFTNAGDFISILRNKIVTARAGATYVTGLTGPVSYPAQNGTATASWVSENPGADLARTNMTTTTSVALAFKTVQAATAVSRQLLFSAASGNFDAEQIIRQDLARVIAVAIDLGALNGSGTSGQPLGVLQNTAVSTYAFGTSGATVAGLDAATIEYNVAANNADDRPLAWITTPAARKKMRVTQAFTGAGDPVWQRDNTVHGMPAFATNQVPANYTKGTSTGICSGLVFGAFEDLIIGSFGPGVYVTVDPFSMKLQNMIDITVTAFVDVALARAASFQVAKDVLTT